MKKKIINDSFDRARSNLIEVLSRADRFSTVTFSKSFCRRIIDLRNDDVDHFIYLLEELLSMHVSLDLHMSAQILKKIVLFNAFNTCQKVELCTYIKNFLYASHSFLMLRIVLNTYLSSLSKILTSDAHALYSDLRSVYGDLISNKKTDAYSHSHMILCAWKMSDIRSAHHYFENARQLFQVNIATINNMLKVASCSADIKLARMLYDMATKQPLVPDQYTFSNLLAVVSALSKGSLTDSVFNFARSVFADARQYIGINVFVYNKMITISASYNKISDSKSLFDEIHFKYKSSDAITVSSAIAAAAIFNDFPYVKYLINLAIADKRLLSKEVYAAYMDAMKHSPSSADLESCLRVFGEIKSTQYMSVRALNAYIFILDKLDALQDLHEIYCAVRSGCEHNAATLSTLIAIFGRHNQIKKVIVCYDLAHQEQMLISSTYSSFIDAIMCCGAENFSRACESFQSAVVNNLFDIYVFNTMLKAASIAHEYDYLWRFFHEFHISVIPDSITYTTMISAFSKDREKSKVIIEMLFRSPIRDMHVYSSILKSVGSTCSMLEAKKYYERAIFDGCESQHLHSIMIDIAGKFNGYSSALHYFSRLPKKFSSDVTIYNSMIKYSGKSGFMRDAINYFNHAETFSFSNDRTVSMLIEAAAINGNIGIARYLFKKYFDNGKGAYSEYAFPSMIKVAISVNDWQLALKWYQQALTERAHSPSLFSNMARAVCYFHVTGFLKNIYNDAKKTGSLNNLLYNKLIMVAGRLGDVEFAVALFNEVSGLCISRFSPDLMKRENKALDPFSFNNLINAASKNSRFDLALRAFEMSEFYRVSDITTYNTMITFASRMKNSKAINKYLLLMDKKNIKHDAYTYAALIRHYTVANPAALDSLFANAQVDNCINSYLYSLILSAYQLNLPKFRTYLDSAERSSMLDVVIYNQLLKVAAIHQAADLAEKAMHALKKYGVWDTPYTQAAYLEWQLATSGFAAADELLTRMLYHGQINPDTICVLRRHPELDWSQSVIDPLSLTDITTMGAMGGFGEVVQARYTRADDSVIPVAIKTTHRHQVGDTQCSFSDGSWSSHRFQQIEQHLSSIDHGGHTPKYYQCTVYQQDTRRWYVLLCRHKQGAYQVLVDSAFNHTQPPAYEVASWRGLRPDQIFLQHEASRYIDHRLVQINQVSLRSFVKEIRLLKQLDHPNVIRFIGVVFRRDRYELVMDYAPGGTLSTWLSHQRGVMVDQTWSHMQGLLEGLCYLHENHIVHGDIKPSNLLLDAHHQIKIADFGLSGFDAAPSGGTPGYIAPEVINGAQQNAASDMFAVAMVVWQLGGLIPALYASWPKEKISQHIQQGGRPEGALDPAFAVLRSLIEKCWDQDPSKRPDAPTVLAEIKKHRPAVTQAAERLSAPSASSLSLGVSSMGIFPSGSEQKEQEEKKTGALSAGSSSSFHL